MTPTALILTAVAVIFVIGLVAVIVERTEQRDEAIKRAAKAEQRAEVFADEICSVHAANEILCAELAASDATIRRLSNDLLAAQLLASDAREELAAAPAPVIPLPVVRHAATSGLSDQRIQRLPIPSRTTAPSPCGSSGFGGVGLANSRRAACNWPSPPIASGRMRYSSRPTASASSGSITTSGRGSTCQSCR